MTISNHKKIFIFLFPFVLTIIFIWIKTFFPIAYESLVEEDSIIEYLQVIFYFLSSALALIISIKLLRNKMFFQGLLYTILTIGLLFVSFEEISWGQRIFNIDTPYFFRQHNFQDEITLHNLTAMSVLHNIYILVGAYGTFSWIIARIFLRWYMVKEKYRYFINSIVPDWFLSSYFLLLFLIYFLFEYISQPRSWTFYIWRDQEVAELFLSLGFLLFLVISYQRLRTLLLENASGINKHGLRMIKPHKKPTTGQVTFWLGKKAYGYWVRIVALIKNMYPNISSEWFFSGKKDGWCLRYKKGTLFCCLIPEKELTVLMMTFRTNENKQIELMRQQLSSQTMKYYDDAKSYNGEKQIFISIDSEKIFADVKKLFTVKLKPKQ